MAQGRVPIAGRARIFAVIAGVAAALFVAPGSTAPVFEQPHPPCGVEPVPDYPALDAEPEIRLWTRGDLGEGWSPPACTPMDNEAPSLVLGLAGHFHQAVSEDEMLARIGAISLLQGIRYWSATDKRWQPLFLRATALEGPDAQKPRGDFSPLEMRAGRELYFLTVDNRSRRETITRLKVNTTEDGEMMVETATVTPLKRLFVTIATPGNIKTWYFMSRDGRDSWRVYSLTRVLYASSFFGGLIPNATYINRAQALYRHLAGIPTDREPPAAR